MSHTAAGDTTPLGDPPIDPLIDPLIDPRGPRFNAALTAVVLAVVLLSAPSVLATLLLGLQAALFALGAVRGVTRTPQAWLFRRVVRPRLSAPSHLESPAPPRFAQAVGLAFTTVGLVGLISGADTVGLVATGLALGAAVVNSAFGLCLGCEAYLLAVRAQDRWTAQPARARATTTIDHTRATRTTT